MITRESQFLINFLNIRVIVNGKDIYTLVPKRPVLVSVDKSNATLIATDGFHYTKALELTFPFPQTYIVKVECAIDNNLLITGVVLLVIFCPGWFGIGFNSSPIIKFCADFILFVFVLYK